MSAGTLAKLTPSMPPSGRIDVRALREAFGLTQTEFAQLGAFHPRTVQHWETGTEPSSSNLKTLRELERLAAEMRKHWHSVTELGAWLKAPNQLWAGQRPMDLIATGHVDMVWRLFYAWDTGDLS